MECGVSDGFGGYNRSISVAAETVIADLVCFNECSSCVIIPTVSVTFKVDMSNEEVSPFGVHVAGSFNDFNPMGTPMVLEGNGVYTATVNIPENTSITYKYINGNDWPGVETVPFECGVNDGFGGYNRNLVTNVSDVLLPTVCFSSCQACIISNVQESQSDRFQFYPNPANDIINLSGISVNSDIFVYDVTGKIVLQTRSNSNKMVINVAPLERGVYIIRNGATNESLRLTIK
jgi:hypothetical protein